MRILLVSDLDPLRVIGGGERLLAGHAQGLAARGHDIVVCSGTPGPSGEHAGVRIVRVGRSIGTPRRVATVVRGFDPDVVLGYQPACAFGALRAAKRRRIPTVYVFLSCWAEEYATRRRRPLRPGASIRWALEHVCLRASDRVVALSEYSAQTLHAVHRRATLDVHLIPGGVDSVRFSPNGSKDAVRRRLGLPPSVPLLVAVRNLVPRMGLDSLIAAMPGVLAAYPEAHLVIAGDGPLRSALQEQTERLGLGARARLAGFVSEDALPDYYRAADLAVVPTRHLEGFGLTTVEALACGTPVVGTPVGATAEILAPVDPALVARDATPDGIARAIIGALRAGPETYSERARELVRSRYTWDRVAAALETMLLEVTG